MKNIMLLNKLKECEGCEGSSMQINEFGFIRGCVECTRNYKVFSNLYGTHQDDGPDTYVDAEAGVLKKVTDKDRSRGYLLLPNGKEIKL